MFLEHYEAGVNVISKGQIGNKYYILRSGKCEVIIKQEGETGDCGPRELLERACQMGSSKNS